MDQAVIIARTRGKKAWKWLKLEPETARLFRMMVAEVRQKYGLNEAKGKESVVTFLVARFLNARIIFWKKS